MNDGTGAQKPTMSAFRTSQALQTPVQAPYTTACSSPEGAGQDQPISTACLCRDPAESGQHGLPAAAPTLPVSEARRQTPCMPAWHSWVTRRARWGRGHEAAAGEDEGEYGESYGKGGKGEKRMWGGQTETWRRRETMKIQQSWRRPEENRWTAWRLVPCERRGVWQTVGLGKSKAMTDFSAWAPLWNDQEDKQWNHSFFSFTNSTVLRATRRNEHISQKTQMRRRYMWLGSSESGSVLCLQV